MNILSNATNKLNQFCSLMKLASWMYRANSKNSILKHMDITHDEVLCLFASFNKYEVKYLLVGGMAGVFHGHIRTTTDLDLWVKSSAENRACLVEALKENGVAGATYLQETQFVFGYTIVKFGTNGFDLDLGDDLKLFKQIDFDSCYARAAIGNMDNVSFSVIQINDLIREKETLGRAKDLGDVEALKKIQNSKLA